jgi:molybdenum cofactor cytidylyltransferase
MKIIGIYLAAGKSTRMGKNKLDLPFHNHYLGSATFRSALDSKLTITFAITRKEDALRFLAPFSKRSGWSYFRCGDEKLSASLKLGVKKAEEWGADAVVVLLADQPFVTTECINRLVAEYQTQPTTLFVSASQQGVCKPPILFSKACFPTLMALHGDEGARAFIRNNVGKSVEFDESIFQDVDTWEDYESINWRWNGIGSDR